MLKDSHPQHCGDRTGNLKGKTLLQWDSEYAITAFNIKVREVLASRGVRPSSSSLI
jgi:hypothetical protein